MSEKPLEPVFDSIEVAGGIVAAYVSNNSVPASELPSLIQGVYDAVRGLTSGSVPSAVTSAAETDRPSSAQIRKSVRPDGIVSFIDGKAYKTLKRHLTTQGFDPKSYRERYGLPVDYPMVAAEYAERRSALAKANGLGQVGAMAAQKPKGRKKVG